MKETREILKDIFLRAFLIVCVCTFSFITFTFIKDWKTKRDFDREYKKELSKHKNDIISPVTRGVHIDTVKKDSIK